MKASYIACLSALPLPVASFFTLDGSMMVTGTASLWSLYLRIPQFSARLKILPWAPYAYPSMATSAAPMHKFVAHSEIVSNLSVSYAYSSKLSPLIFGAIFAAYFFI